MDSEKKEILQTKLEELSMLIVMSDLKNLQSLTDIHTKLEEVIDLKADTYITDTAIYLSNVIERIILDEVPDKIKAMQEVSENVSKMQTVVRTEEIPKNEKPESNDAKTEKADNKINLPSNVDEEILNNFLVDQVSTLEEMENLILSIEKEYDTNKIDALKRIFHTIKGEAGVLGMKEVGELCHKTEDYMEQEKDNISVDRLLVVKDWLLNTFNAYSQKDVNSTPLELVLEQLNGNTKIEINSTKENVERSETFPGINMAESDDPGLVSDFIGEANEHLEQADESLLILESNPEDEEAINSIFRVFHTIKGVASFLDFKAIQTLSHSTENLLDLARKKEITLSGARIDIVFSSVDAAKNEINSLQNALEDGSIYRSNPQLPQLIAKVKELCNVTVNNPKPIGEILVSSGDVKSEDVRDAFRKQIENPDSKIGEILVENGSATNEQIEDALKKQKLSKKTVKVKETIKVDTERLDKLVDSIGELVIAEAMVTGDEDITRKASAKAIRNMRQLDKITRELQEIGLAMRLVSVKSTFQKMARLVRDLAKKSGKKINFETSGEDTELDKTIIEHIGDPLVHMIRNSADHGIETPEERVKNGKSPEGTIRLRAFQKGGNISIEIEDDGKGLDKDAILAKAKSQGIIKENEKISDHDIHQLIFRAGFSTAKKITDVSGRGVGMDVVKKNIETLRGNVEIKTEKGKGSTFSMQLPLTMAIMDGMVVKVGKERYILPTLSVIETFRPEESDLSTAVGKGEMVKVHNQMLPLLRLSTLFDVKDAVKNSAEGIIMVVEDMGKRVGILVDDIIGQQQTVIKNLGDGVGEIQGVSGGAIMTDGNISLIVDIAGIIREKS